MGEPASLADVDAAGQPVARLPYVEATQLGVQRVRPGDYVALQPCLPRTEDVRSRLATVRLRPRDRLRVATTLGFGPRYLHSTGQFHRGGSNSGVFIQLMDGGDEDVPIPGRAFSFGQLLRAQAQGDLESLRSLGRRVVRARLEELEAAAR